MLQWDALHPYNAIHVVRIPRAFDAVRLQNALQATLQTLGLTGLVMDRRTGAYEYRGGPARCEITTIAPGAPALEEEITRQLNTPFAPAALFNPFRFFVAPEADAFRLGLVYFHAVADAESIVRLVQAIVGGHSGGSAAAPGTLELHPRPANLLLRQPGLLARKLLALPAQLRDMKQSFRPSHRGRYDLISGFTLFALSPEQWRALRAVGKSWDVTVNDLFLAVLLKSFSVLAVLRTSTSRRQKLSVGCVVNAREDLGVDGARTFGVQLGSFIVSHEVPPAISLRELAADVHCRTQRVKQDRLYLAAALEMVLAGAVLGWFAPERRKLAYHKNYPLWGGITNLNLNPLWLSIGAAPLPDYFRAVSTGPVTPVVLSVTTVGETVNLGLSYRTAFFTAPEMEKFKKIFLEQVEQLQSRA